MKRKRWSCLILCLLLVLGFTLGCAASRQEDFDTRPFYASFKPQDDDAYGKKTACYDGRIYYLSDESGTQGVHSMRPDGSDVRLELITEDIRSIQIEKESIWLLSYIGIERIGSRWWRSFRIFRVDRMTDEITPLSETLPRKKTEWLADVIPWQAYAFPNGMVALRYAKVNWDGRYLGRITFMQDGDLLRIPREPNLFYQASGAGGIRQDVQLWEFDGLLICGRSAYEYGTDACTVLDMRDGRQPFFTDTSLSVSTWEWERAPIFAKDGVVYFHCNDAIEVFDSEKETMRTLMQATDDEPIRIALPSADGTKLLLLAQTWTRRPQQLYRADLARGESQLLLRLPRSAAFVYLDETRAIAAKGKKLLFYDLTGEQAEQTGTVELSTRIVDRRNKVECAGGWLFLYRFNDKTMRDELVEKVRIG